MGIEETENYMRSLETKELGGDLLFFRNDNDCLTINRWAIGIGVDRVEGDWTEQEQDAACNIYEEYGASRV